MTSLTLFFTVFLAVFIAEMGDKTQLLLIAMTSKYKVRDILIGTTAAIFVLNALAVLAGGLLNEFLKTHLWIVRLIACVAFFYFSISSLLKSDDDESSSGSKIQFAPLAVFCIFFIAEFGDKTQLTAITFGATNGLNANALVIWISSSIALLVADLIGLVVGHFLHGKTPDRFFNLLAFVIFAVFGFVNLPSGLYLLLNENSAEIAEPSFSEMVFETPYALPILCTVALAFVAICVIITVRNRKRG